MKEEKAFSSVTPLRFLAAGATNARSFTPWVLQSLHVGSAVLAAAAGYKLSYVNISSGLGIVCFEDETQISSSDYLQATIQRADTPLLFPISRPQSITMIGISFFSFSFFFHRPNA